MFIGAGSMFRSLLMLSLFFILPSNSYAFNCKSSFGVASPPNQKVARLMNQVMKHHWSFKELISAGKELETIKKPSRIELKKSYDALLTAEKSSVAIIKAFTLILENKDGSWLMGGIVPDSKSHMKSNQIVAEIIEMYSRLHATIEKNIANFTKQKIINYREVDNVVMEIMDLSEQGHRLHK